MVKIASILGVIVSSFFLASCKADFYVEHEVGDNGEHPTKHAIRYKKSFVVLRKDLMKSLDSVHTFSEERGLYVRYHECFTKLFGYKQWFVWEQRGKYFPCIITNSELGSPNKANIVFNVTKVDYNLGLEHIEYEISISTHYDKITTPEIFVQVVEPELIKLNNKFIETKQSFEANKGTPHNKSFKSGTPQSGAP